jgi:exosortase A-associated hydrolase 2
MPSSLTPFFLPSEQGQRFCIHHAASAPVRGVVLHVHAWAEEMNKSRRMVAMTSRALASNGFAVLRIDLQGCGDSDGDFGDASWQAWLGDVLAGARWLAKEHPQAPLWLWGQRTGALLTAQAAAQLPPGTHHLLWQPVTAGKTVLQQFLRLKAASGMQQGDAKQALERARADLAAGRAVDVAGYVLQPALANGLEQATLDPPPSPGCVRWIETTTRTPAELLPGSAAPLARWQAAAHDLQAVAVNGPQFWQTQEIEDAPALVDATVLALRGAGLSAGVPA